MTNEPNTPAPESFEARTYDDGKYTVFKRHDGGLGFLRHGEAWPAADDLRWQNVVMEMFREQIEADALVAKLRGELEAEKAVREGAEKKQERAESAWTKLDNEYAALQTSADETDGKLEAEKAVSKGLRERVTELEAALRGCMNAMVVWGQQEDGIPHERLTDAFGCYLRGKFALRWEFIDGEMAAFMESNEWRAIQPALEPKEPK